MTGIADVIRKRRQELDISLNELAARLNLRGYSTTKATVHHWERGLHNPPLNNPDFRFNLAQALEMDVNDMMRQAGFFMGELDRSPEARRGADIIDGLPEEKRETAVRLLEALR